jgi:beta-glucosidase
MQSLSIEEMKHTMQSKHITFPQDFLWGTATASYQVEGGVKAHGRGLSIWDTFCYTPGKVVNGDTGDVACDHYHRYDEDIELMAQLGLKAYRFSVAWPRVLPTGTGQVNHAGLDFYDRLVDSLLQKGIQPFATLYHWDLPQPLQDKGGWPNRATVDAFVHYADVVSRKLGDRVHNWMTINEPWCVAFLGYGLGIHAPGDKDFSAALQAAHHVLLAHGQAVPVLRRNAGKTSKVGIVTNHSWVDAASTSAEDQSAARRMDGFLNRWFLDPLFKGGYPNDMLEHFRAFKFERQPGDMAVIAAPLDFLGVNYYTRTVVAAAPDDPIFHARILHPEGEYTEMDWEVYPFGLYKFLMRLQKEYAPPAVYITENGAAFNDVPTPDGEICDERRQAYLESHFDAAHRALNEGVRLKGYFVWSFMDNFEWAFGYTKRFGIVYVDYKTLKRTVKQSGQWYAEVIKENGFQLIFS